METLIHRRVEAARQGQNSAVICRMPSGWAVLGDSQFLIGYSLLLPDPVVPSLNDLSLADRQRYLLDSTLIGDSLLEVTDTYRINYETLGNSDQALHTHIFPRYLSEPDGHRRMPVFNYPRTLRESRPLSLERDGAMKEALARSIASRL